MLETDVVINPGQAAADPLASIREAFNADRSQMTLMLARKLKVQEVDVIRALEGDLSCELDFSRWEELIRSFESFGNVHVIVSNGAATIEAFGTFGKFSNTEGFFNVQSKSLDMHIRTWELASIFAMRKPSHMDGREALSFQFFDRRGDAAFKVFLTFGGHDPTPELLEKYNGLIEKFAKVL
jgi:putative heme iron utilization protein